MVQQPSAKARIGFPMQLREDGSRAPEWAPRVIALYLPQFHPVPENDVFWGEGSTEWSTVVRGKPLFPGHYQPRIPADLGFYDLRLPEVRQAQADLARSYGIHGFCYYHYWFKGRRVLDRPFQEVLESGHPDFPFSLCWANHS
jgi:lipopolysaccharide biosynthesis protein